MQLNGIYFAGVILFFKQGISNANTKNTCIVISGLLSAENLSW